MGYMSRFLRPLIFVAFLTPASLMAFPVSASADARTYYVDGARGSDAAEGTSTKPLQTISRAAAVVHPGDTVLVRSGRYREQVQLTTNSRGVTYRGTGNAMPIVDGQGVRRWGFLSWGNAPGVVIEGFEVTRQRFAGVEIEGNSHGAIVRNNRIHDVHDPKGLFSLGFRGGEGTRGLRVENNTIYSIGPGGESMGVMLIKTRDAVVHGNLIYLCRKEGIRDWAGLDNRITSNRTLLNWVGIALNGSAGTVVENNYSYSNVIGFNPKHVSDPGFQREWGLDSPRWTRISHNIAYANTGASVVLGGNAPVLDYLDVRDNVFAQPGTVQIHDFPGSRGSHVSFDRNIYLQQAKSKAVLYFDDWTDPHPNVLNDIASMRRAFGWERHGQVAALTSVDPAAGEIAYSGSQRRPRFFARGLKSVGLSWRRFPMVATASSIRPSWAGVGGASDGRSGSYWMSTPGETSGWVDFDLGVRRSFNMIVLDVFSHWDPRNVKGYDFAVSRDGRKYRSVLRGSNPDPAGSSFKYQLRSRVNARYLRFRMRSNFGGKGLIFSDLGVGMLRTGAGSVSKPRLRRPAGSARQPSRSRRIRAGVRGKLPRLGMHCLRGVRVDLRLRGRVLARGNARIHRGCRYSRSLSFRVGKLPRRMRSRRARVVLNAVASLPDGRHSPARRIRVHR
jgi:parallel beta-helix repeat protein